MNFAKVRPYANQVAEIVQGTGVLPLDNEACTYLSNVNDANVIFAMMLQAAKASQGSNRLGIPNPEPVLTMMSGKEPIGKLAANDQMDLIDGSVNIAYYSADAPRAYVVRGTVIIPNQEFPAEQSQWKKYNIDVYIGRLIAAITGPVTTLVFDTSDGEFVWH